MSDGFLYTPFRVWYTEYRSDTYRTERRTDEMMTLRELPIGKKATITTVGGEGALRQHFLDMGGEYKNYGKLWGKIPFIYKKIFAKCIGFANILSTQFLI